MRAGQRRRPVPGELVILAGLASLAFLAVCAVLEALGMAS